MRDTQTNADDHRSQEIAVTDIKLHFVENCHDGLIAWASCILGGTVVLNNIAVRRGRDGNLMLTYPAKRTSAGSRFYYHNPINTEAAAVIERAIIGALQKIFMESAVGQIKDEE